jgi:hypothetical protein
VYETCGAHVAPAREEGTVTYGVTVQTLDRLEGNGVTMLLVDALNPGMAELRAREIAELRFHCTVLVDHAVPCPGFVPSAQALALD